MNLIKAIFSLKCPHCRKGDLFELNNPYRLKKLNVMNDSCSVCCQKFVIEPGFYLGAAYVSYALQVMVMVVTYLTLSSFTDLYVNWIIASIAIIILFAAPYFIVLSRSFWISFFVSFDSNFKN